MSGGGGKSVRLRRTPIKETYASAGVNIDLGLQVKKWIAQYAQSTFRPEVLGGIGFFGGMYEFKGYKNPVLVSHVDGVGTKLKLAVALNKNDTIGIDIVNHCVNDIFTCGAEPLFFLDYIGIGKLNPEQIKDIVKGLVSACKEVGCSLIGGETAEMPGVYSEGEYDLVGFIIGVVEKEKVMKGERTVIGDVILGLPSSGLHTNGYSLVRKLFGETPAALNKPYPELGRTLGEALLEPHRCYYKQLKPLLPQIKGLAHITGGSFYKNIPRVLPAGMAAELDSRSWTVPPLFKLIQDKGNVDRDEMYHVFNMGIGMAVICSPEHVDRLMKQLPEAKIIGKVMAQKGEARVAIRHNKYPLPHMKEEVMAKLVISTRWYKKGGKPREPYSWETYFETGKGLEYMLYPDEVAKLQQAIDKGYCKLVMLRNDKDKRRAEARLTKLEKTPKQTKNGQWRYDVHFEGQKEVKPPGYWSPDEQLKRNGVKVINTNNDC